MFAYYQQDGHSLRGLAKHLRELGVHGPRGSLHWSDGTIRHILTNPGRRVQCMQDAITIAQRPDAFPRSNQSGEATAVVSACHQKTGLWWPRSQPLSARNSLR